MITNYRKKNRRLVTLSDGSTVHVRSLSIAEVASLNIKGEVKDALQDNHSKQAEMQRLMLCNCVFLPEGERIVDKDAQDCGEKEISWKEIEQPDVKAICAAIGEEAAKADTFQVAKETST